VIPESTVVSPTANSRNGSALWKNAATARCPHIRRSRGRRARCSRHSSRSMAAPSTSRASTSCTGENIPSPSLIQKKLEPHISAAARNLGYTPSAISQQLSALEREAGTELLERVGRGVRPTPAGALLSEHAETLSCELAKAEAALTELKAGRIGSVSIRYFAT